MSWTVYIIFCSHKHVTLHYTWKELKHFINYQMSSIWVSFASCMSLFYAQPCVSSMLALTTTSISMCPYLFHFIATSDGKNRGTHKLSRMVSVWVNGPKFISILDHECFVSLPDLLGASVYISPLFTEACNQSCSILLQHLTPGIGNGVNLPRCKSTTMASICDVLRSSGMNYDKGNEEWGCKWDMSYACKSSSMLLSGGSQCQVQLIPRTCAHQPPQWSFQSVTDIYSFLVGSMTTLSVP